MLDVFKQLFPDGLYELEDGPMAQGLEAEAGAWTDADEAATALLLEILPDTATQLLSEWEAELGILPPATASEAERRAFATAWHGMTANLSIPHLKWLAALILGYEPEIREITVLRVGFPNAVGVARLGGQGFAYQAHMDIDPAQTDIGTYERSRLEQVIEYAHAAGVRLSVGFKGGFKVGSSQVGKDKLA